MDWAATGSVAGCALLLALYCMTLCGSYIIYRPIPRQHRQIHRGQVRCESSQDASEPHLASPPPACQQSVLDSNMEEVAGTHASSRIVFSSCMGRSLQKSQEDRAELFSGHVDVVPAILPVVVAFPAEVNAHRDEEVRANACKDDSVVAAEMLWEASASRQ